MQTVQLQIGNKKLGTGQSPLIIAEIGQAHDGSLGMAHAFIDAVADAGVDAIKFQTHIASAESTYDEPFRVKFSYQDDNRFNYWKRMEFPFDQWVKLYQHALERDLIFLSSPFSIEAAQMLTKIGMEAWKVGSGEFESETLIDFLIKTKKPILFSTGMSSWAEIDNVVSKLEKSSVDFVILQCTSCYPTPLEKVGLNAMKEMQSKYECLVGLSDHSGTLYPGLAAMVKGASIIEVHVTFHKQMFGPDVSSSLTLEELKFLCNSRDAFHLMENKTVDKNKAAEELTDVRCYFGKSLALKESLPAGTLLEKDMLTSKKPAGGISPDKAQSLIGKILRKDVDKDRLLKPDDVEGDIIG